MRIVLMLLSICLIGCQKDSSDSKKARPNPKNNIQVTLNEGTNMAVALAPNKKDLAIDLQGTIWTLSLSGGTAKPLTDYLGDCHEPSWSPDGSQIAFQSYRDGNYHIWTVDLDGSMTKITDGPFDHREPHWSSQGELFYSSDRQGNYDIWKFANGVNTPVTDAQEDEYFPFVQGNKVLYITQKENQYDLIQYELSTQSVETLHSSNNRLSNPTLNPSGSNWLVNEISGNSSISIYGNEDGLQAQVDLKEDLFPFKVAWIDDNNYLVTSNGLIKKRSIKEPTLNQNIPFEAVVNLHRPRYKRKTYVLDSKADKQVKGILSPVLSPDGNLIAFCAKGDLWIYDIQDQSTRQITDDKYIDLEPSWSPNSQSVFFVTDRMGGMDIWEYKINESSINPLYDDESSLAYPVISPDGKKMATFQRDRENIWLRGQLKIVDLDSKESELVDGSFFAPSRISWSPDSKKISMIALKAASGRFREGVSQVYIFNLNTKRRVSFSPTPNVSVATRNVNGPIWLASGNEVAYILGGQLHKIKLDNNDKPIGDPELLYPGYAAAPSFSSDSKLVLFQSMDKMILLNLERNEHQVLNIDLFSKPTLNEQTYAIHVGKLFRGTGSKYEENMDIVIQGSRIEKIEPHRSDRTMTTIDAKALSAFPALIESHTHQHAAVGEKLGRSWLAFGITTVREPGTNPYDALYRKETWQSSRQVGPRVFFTGGLADGSRIYYDIANSIVNKEQLAMELEMAQALEYDLIKTYVRLEDSLQEYITERAHAMGIPVSSHEIYPSTKYNVDGVEHIRGTSRRGYSLKQSNLNRTYSDVDNLLAKSGMYITPTIGLQGGFYVMSQRYPEILDNDQFKALYGKGYIDGMRQRLSTLLRLRPGFLDNFDPIFESIKKIKDAGGLILAGTDSPFIPYGFSLQTEIQLYVELGMTPSEAIQCATLTAAKALNIDDQLGSLEEGKLADLILVQGDPLADIKDLLKVEYTFKNGIQYAKEQLINP